MCLPIGLFSTWICCGEFLWPGRRGSALQNFRRVLSIDLKSQIINRFPQVHSFFERPVVSFVWILKNSRELTKGQFCSRLAEFVTANGIA